MIGVWPVKLVVHCTTSRDLEYLFMRRMQSSTE